MEATKNAMQKQQLRPTRTEYDAEQFEVPLPPVWASLCQKTRLWPDICLVSKFTLMRSWRGAGVP